MSRSIHVLACLACLFRFLMCPLGTDAQSLLQSTDDGTDLFDKFQDAQFQDKTDKEVMQEEFRKKRAAYESLMSRESPIFFQADVQEIDDTAKVFTLSGNVEIYKDVFRLKADWVRIHQWSGDLEARGNVVLEFDRDVLTGDEASFNFNTGTGWISNARAAVEPHLYLETDLLEKLPDFEKNGQGQYAMQKAVITACAAEKPAWKFYAKYAVIRLEDYAHMNGVSAWIRNIPIFWMPYFFYPTKTDRATGLLTPNVNWSTTRGMVYEQEFFLRINDYMDATAGLTWFSIIGVQQEFQFRNAFSPLSKGELNVTHIKERKSPSSTRDPEERWRMTYEQNAVFPGEIRGTANLVYQSDESFNEDYGDWNQGVNQYLDSRISLTRYWGTAGLTLDASYLKYLSTVQDERLQYLPRLEYFTGWRHVKRDFRWQLKLKGEQLRKATNELATLLGDPPEMKWQRLEKEAFRFSMNASIGYDFNEIPWLNVYPWISVDERYWNDLKTPDPAFENGTWATYATPPEDTDNSWMGSLSASGDGIFRHVMKTGIDVTGPKFYRIFDVLGYKTLERTKHIIEPKISLEYTPEVTGQEEILYFDLDDMSGPGTKLTYSLTTRLLMKLKGKESSKARFFEENSDDPPKDDATAVETPDETLDQSRMRSQKEGVIREFGYLTISQTYDFFKADRWQERIVEPGMDERIFYPFSNINLNLTINPVSNLYLAGRIDYDPWHDEFANGYIYGHVKQKKWEFGLRWDYTRNFLDDFYNTHALALEGGAALSDTWRFGTWVKYDFSGNYVPYIYLDLTYMAQCWGVTLHTIFRNNREYDLFARTYQNDNEMKFGLSLHLKNIDTIDTDTFGKFYWGGSR